MPAAAVGPEHPGGKPEDVGVNFPVGFGPGSVTPFAKAEDDLIRIVFGLLPDHGRDIGKRRNIVEGIRAVFHIGSSFLYGQVMDAAASVSVMLYLFTLYP